MPHRIAALGHERPIGRCRYGASFALYVVGVCLNRIGTHQILPPKHGRIIGSMNSAVDVFTHSGSKAEVQRGSRNVRFWGKSRHHFRATGCLLLAKRRHNKAAHTVDLVAQLWRCPLYPQKRTFRGPRWTSAFDPGCVKTSTALFMLPMILPCFDGRV